MAAPHDPGVSAADVQVVAEAGEGAGAVEQVRRHRPDVVLMDIHMPATDGLAATRLITALPVAPRTYAEASAQLSRTS